MPGEFDFAVLPPDGVFIPAFSGTVDGWPETHHRSSVSVGTTRLESGAPVSDHAEAEPFQLTCEGWVSGLTVGVAAPASDIAARFAQPLPSLPNRLNPIVRSAISAVRLQAEGVQGGREVVALIDDIRSETELTSPNSQRLEVGFLNLKSALHNFPPSAFATGPMALAVERLEVALVEAPGESPPVAAPASAIPVPTIAGGEKHTLRKVWGVVMRLRESAATVEVHTALASYKEMILVDAALTQDEARFRLRFLQIRRAEVGLDVPAGTGDFAGLQAIAPGMGPAIGRGPLSQAGRPTVTTVTEFELPGE